MCRLGADRVEIPAASAGMTEWQSAGMTEWQSAGMTEWQSAGMTERQSARYDGAAEREV